MGNFERTRRQMIKLAGAGSVAALAGCGSDGDSAGQATTTTTTTEADGGDDTTEETTTTTTTATTTEASTGRIDQTFRAATTQVPSDLHLSQYNPKSYGKTFARYLYDQPAIYASKLGEWLPAVAANWTVEGDTLTMTVQPDQTWSNGEPVTAEDFRVKWDIQNVVPGTLGTLPSYHEEWSVTDEKRFEVTFDGPVNPDIAKADLFTRKFLIDTPRFTWEKFAEMARDATSEDAKTEVRNQVTQHEPKLSEAITNGPFAVEDVGSRGAAFAVRESGHPASDPEYSPRGESDDWWLNFTTYDFTKFQEGAVTLQAMLSDKLELGGGGSLPQQRSILNDPPENVRAIKTPGDFDGVGLAPDHTHEWFGKREVRQALAYAVSGSKIAEAFNPLANEASKYMCGVFNGDYERFLPNIHDKLNPYPQDQEKVDEMMQAAGLSKQDGIWTKPDGESLDTTVISPPWNNWAQASLSLVKQLQSAGFDAKLSTISANNWFSRWNERDYILTITVWGDLWLPYRNFQSSYDQFSNAPDTMMAPMPVGDPNGEVQEVDVKGAMEELVTATGEQATELNERLAWVWNQSLPILNYTQNSGIVFVRNSRFEWPPSDHWAWTVSFQSFNFPKLGLVKARPQ